ncbi:MAG: hypothetical protein P8Y27_04975 [Chromatiaceae bacterium]
MKITNRLSDVANALVALPRELQRLVDAARNIERVLMNPLGHQMHLVTLKLTRYLEAEDVEGSAGGVYRYVALSRRLKFEPGLQVEFRFESLAAEAVYDFALCGPQGFLVCDIRIGTRTCFENAGGGVLRGQIHTGEPGEIVRFMVGCF